MTEREFIRMQEEIRAIQKRMLAVDAFEGRLDEVEKITAVLQDSDEELKKDKIAEALQKADARKLEMSYQYSAAIENRKLYYGIGLVFLTQLAQIIQKLWEAWR